MQNPIVDPPRGSSAAAHPRAAARRSSPALRPLRAIALLGGLAACGEQSPFPPDTRPCQPEVTSVMVRPGAITLPVGASLAFAATAVGNACLPNFAVTWRSSDTTIVPVSATGTAFGRAPGTATIIAVAQFDSSMRGTAAVTVR